MFILNFDYSVIIFLCHYRNKLRAKKVYAIFLI